MPGKITRSRIVKDLKALGAKRGEILAVHSSLKSIKDVEGGPQAVVDALKEAVGSSGTIIMPVFTNPKDVFIAKDEPSSNGPVSETFRKSPGTLRSLHPTHSVAAWGKQAHHIVREHQKRQALGVNSPFHRLAKRDGRVLTIGVGYTKASIIHVAESIAAAPYQNVFYPGYKRSTMVVSGNGKRFKYTPKENPGDTSAFTAVEEYMRDTDKLIEGKIGNAHAMLAPAKDIIKACLELLSKDGASLLCNRHNCDVCPKRRIRVKRLRWHYYAKKL